MTLAVVTLMPMAWDATSSSRIATQALPMRLLANRCTAKMVSRTSRNIR